MKWDLEEFAYADFEPTVRSADNFVHSIPTFSKTTEEITEAIRNRLINAYGSTRYQNKRLQLVIRTAELLSWGERLGICIDKDQEFDPRALLTIADYSRRDFKLYTTSPKKIVRAYFTNLGDNQPIADYKIIIHRNTLPEIVLTEGAFKTANDRLLSIRSLLQLKDIINSAQDHFAK